MELEQALARIADLEGQVTTLTGERDMLADERNVLVGERDALVGERDTLAGRATDLEEAQAALDARLAEATGAHTTVAAELAATQQALSAAQAQGLDTLRRALLAEQAGQIVPELVGGLDETALLASVEMAKQAYGRAVEAARARIAQQTVPAGAPSARSGSAAGLSPLEMIESGLRK